MKFIENLKIWGFFLVLFFSQPVFGQMDTIYLSDHKTPCLVREVGPEEIKYNLPGEDVVNSIYKSTVKKIVFRSGRVETYANPVPDIDWSSPLDFEKIYLTKSPNDPLGWYSLNNLKVFATGGTIFSKGESVRKRALNKLKMQASMLGAKMVEITREDNYSHEEGNLESNQKPSTYLDGTAYTDKLLNLEEFNNIMKGKRDFLVIHSFTLRNNANQIQEDTSLIPFRILQINQEDGIIYLEGNLEYVRSKAKYQLISFKENEFIILFQKDHDFYDYRVRIQ